jgi:hypothetical protein
MFTGLVAAALNRTPAKASAPASDKNPAAAPDQPAKV